MLWESRMKDDNQANYTKNGRRRAMGCEAVARIFVQAFEGVPTVIIKRSFRVTLEHGRSSPVKQASSSRRFDQRFDIGEGDDYFASSSTSFFGRYLTKGSVICMKALPMLIQLRGHYISPIITIIIHIAYSMSRVINELLNDSVSSSNTGESQKKIQPCTPPCAEMRQGFHIQGIKCSLSANFVI